MQRSHDLSNVASNTKEAVPVCQQENTQPALPLPFDAAVIMDVAKGEQWGLVSQALNSSAKIQKITVEKFKCSP